MRSSVSTLMVLALIILSGCATIRTYVVPDEESAWIVFGDHMLEPLVDTSLYDQKATNFRFSIWQSQPAPADTTIAGSQSYVDVRDLTLVSHDSIPPLKLERQDPENTKRWLADDGRVHGPVMHWNRVPLGDKYDVISLRFTAVLIDGETGEEVASEVEQYPMRRIDDRVPAWHR